MSAIAPRWALMAQAIDGIGDPLLEPGVHVRLLPSDRVGLPIVPFDVRRVALGPSAANATLRTDIVWTGAGGNILTPPFDVTPDSPVTGWLPAPVALGSIADTVSPTAGVCCWIAVNAQVTPPLSIIEVAREAVRTVGGLRPVPSPSGELPMVEPAVPIPPRPTSGEFVPPDIARGTRPWPFPRPIPFPWANQLRVDAVVATPRGPAVLASRVTQPYEIGFSRIERVIVSGRGRVFGVRWLDARSVKAPNAP